MASSTDGVQPVEVVRTLVKNRSVSSIRLLSSRLWNAAPPGKFAEEAGLDFIGIDEEGNAIHVVIERKHAAYYRQILKEGSVYIFCNLGCVPAGYYRPIMRGERLRINSGSKVFPDPRFSGHIERHHFEFQTFAAASARLNKDTLLTDLIGVLTKIEDPMEGNTKHGEGTRTKFYIQDLDGNQFPVNLWGDLSLQFRALNLLDAKDTIVIIVCAMSIRQYEGEIHASSMSPSKFYINLPVPEVSDYLSRYEPLHVVPEMLPRTGKMLAQISAKETIQHKTIADLLSGPSSAVKIGQRYNCVATVIDFEVDRGWFYIACKKCLKKLPPPELNLGCQTCHLGVSDSMPWYRVEAVVEDTSGTANFVLFGKSGEKLIGAPASFLANSATMDPQVLHPLMERVIGNSRIFQVTLKENTFGDRTAKIVVQNIFSIPQDHDGNIQQEPGVPLATGKNAECSSDSIVSKKRLVEEAFQVGEPNNSSVLKKLHTSAFVSTLELNDKALLNMDRNLTVKAPQMMISPSENITPGTKKLAVKLCDYSDLVPTAIENATPDVVSSGNVCKLGAKLSPAVGEAPSNNTQHPSEYQASPMITFKKDPKLLIQTPVETTEDGSVTSGKKHFAEPTETPVDGSCSKDSTQNMENDQMNEEDEATLQTWKNRTSGKVLGNKKGPGRTKNGNL